MTSKQLRDSILQAAIQGQLVPQEPSDTPATLLLERIQAERERLIKEKKIRRDKNASVIYRTNEGSYYERNLASGEETCIDDEIPFDIPDSWQWSRGRNVIQLLSGRDLLPTQYNDKGIGVPYITGASNFSKNSLIINRWTNQPVTISRKGELLITCKGTIGAMAFNKIGEVHVARQIMSLSSILVSLKYVKLFLRFYVTNLQEIAKGIIPGFSREDILSSLIPIPPLEEQERIVARIEELMTLVDQYDQAKVALDELESTLPDMLQQSILQAAIQGQLVPQEPSDTPAALLLERIQAERERLIKEKKIRRDKNASIIYRTDEGSYYERILASGEETCIDEEIPFDIPDSWQWTRLSSISELYTGNSINEVDKRTKYTNVIGVDYIGTKDVEFDHTINYQNGVAIPKEHLAKFRLAPTDSILLCIEGGSAGRKIALVNREVCFGNKLCCFVSYDLAYSKYIYYYLQSPAFFESFRDSLTGIIGGVSLNRLKQLIIPIPPLEEQERIVARIEELMRYTDRLKSFTNHD